MKVAIYNPHMAPNIINVGAHNYIINLIRDGHTPYIFIDQIDKNYTKSAIKRLIGHLPIQLFDALCASSRIIILLLHPSRQKASEYLASQFHLFRYCLLSFFKQNPLNL